jgi:tRNA A-37 threonylcarbamoyl transferase component Bud32
LRSLGAPSPFAGDFEKVRRLEALGLQAPRPLAASLRSLGRTEFLVTEFLQGSICLKDLLWCGSSRIEDPRELAEVFSELGAWLRRVHDCGVWHRDLKTGNIMVRCGASGLRELVLVDLVAVRFFRRPLGDHRTSRNLGQVLDLPARFDSLARRPLFEAYAGSLPASGDLERRVDRVVQERRRYRKRKCGFAYVDEEHFLGTKP